MQGRKEYQEKLFTSFQLSTHVPQGNIYRRILEEVDFRFIYKLTAKYYGTEGQKSIDPVVFFKLLLFGYMENIPSDRRIVENAKMRLDALFFLGYDLDEALPWHSTLSRTRQLYGEEVFLTVFQKVLSACAGKGMLSGRRQAIDSYLMKANASIEGMVEKELENDTRDFFKRLEEEAEKEAGKKAPTEKPPKKTNKTHVSPSDPDARLSTKQGKAAKLNHLAQVSVDTGSHLITHAEAFAADGGDAPCLAHMVGQVGKNLAPEGMAVEEVLADSGYSSSENLEEMDNGGIRAYIPNKAGYKKERDGFSYDEENDHYICSEGKVLPFKGVYHDMGYPRKKYRSTSKDCAGCPLRTSCTGEKAKFKTITVTLAKPLFDKMDERMSTKRGKRMRRLRHSTVEPVIGSLSQHFGAAKSYAKGRESASKNLLLASMAYNLKKLINFKPPKTRFTAVDAVPRPKKNQQSALCTAPFATYRHTKGTTPILTAYSGQKQMVAQMTRNNGKSRKYWLFGA
jgi:transposase